MVLRMDSKAAKTEAQRPKTIQMCYSVLCIMYSKPFLLINTIMIKNLRRMRSDDTNLKFSTRSD
jgi:hypothetical protein